MPLLRVLLVTAGAVVVGGGALLGVATAATGDEVPRGVHLLGTDLGGTPRDEARARVEEVLAPLLEDDVLVRADDEEAALEPSAAGLGVDVEAVVAAALQGGPVDRLQGLLGARRDVAPVPTVDEAALREALGEVQAAVDRPPREGTVVFQGVEPVAVPPLTGRELDLDAAVATVSEQWVDGEEPLALEVAVEEVRTTQADVDAVLEGVARPAVAAPVTVQAGDASFEVRPEDVAAALSFEVDEAGSLAPRLSGEDLLASLGERVAPVERDPVDARIRIAGGAPQVVPAQTGLRVPAQPLADAVAPVLRAPAPREAEVELEVAEPELTTAEAEGLGVREVVASYTTEFPCCAPRVTNIRRIAELVDGALVLPGETYSLNDDVGRRTLAKGFVPAPQILDGEFVDDVGGGVSQFATTMFNAVFFAGLEDVEHKPHSYYITRYPEGREATVFYPHVDLKWRNDSPHGVLVTTSSTRTSVTVTLWGTKRYEIRAEKGPRTRVRPFEKRYVQRDDCTPADGHEGFDVVVTRVFLQDGREVRREDFRTRYLPEPNFICGPPPPGESST